MSCTRCGSSAINHHAHGRDGSDGDLCDVCYWRKRAEIESHQTEIERASRQAAQIDCEALKERAARAGVEQRNAVFAEREACAKACEEWGAWSAIAQDCAAAIRARRQP